MTKVIVIGSGVSGLTCGVSLLEKGFEVEIIARDFPPNTTSNVAAAWWFFYKTKPVEKLLQWGSSSLEKFKSLYADQNSGVFPVEFVELLQPTDPIPLWGALSDRHGFLDQQEIPNGYAQAYRGIVPVCDSSIYLPYLIARFDTLGGVRRNKVVSSIEQDLKDCAVIINCAGVWSGELAKDKDSYPIRGQAIRLTKPKITPRCWADGNSDSAPIFIVPRVNDYVVGTTAEVGRWDLKADQASTKKILEKVNTIEPALSQCKILEVIVGLRPGRSEIRLEREVLDDGRVVVHNYGHGGSGFSLSWGCAEEAISLISKL
jgi:D-amino-acid oxidase